MRQPHLHILVTGDPLVDSPAADIPGMKIPVSVSLFRHIQPAIRTAVVLLLQNLPLLLHRLQYFIEFVYIKFHSLTSFTLNQYRLDRRHHIHIASVYSSSDLIYKHLKANDASHQEPHTDRSLGHTALSADTGLFSLWGSFGFVHLVLF